MRTPSFLLGCTVAASFFAGILAGPCKVSTSTTSSAPTTTPTFTAVGQSTEGADPPFIGVDPIGNGNGVVFGTKSELSSFYQYDLNLEPSTGRLMGSGFYFYARPSPVDSNVFTGSAAYIDSSAGLPTAAAYIQCNPPVLGTALQCTLEGSTKSQFRLAGFFGVAIGDPNVSSSNSAINLIIS